MFSRSILATAVATVAVSALGAFAQVQGPSSSQTAYVVPTVPGVITKSLLSTGDAIGGYKLAGTPDGMGFIDNNDGSFQLFVNHEFSTTQGIARSHGNTVGAFVSSFKIDKTTHTVLAGNDLITSIVNANTNVALTGSALNLNRLCSADLPAAGAFYNTVTGKGTTERLFMNGEENGSTVGRAFASVVTGPSKGTSYFLPSLGAISWENAVANPATGDITMVIGNDDTTPSAAGTGEGVVSVYLGTKTNGVSDSIPQKAGLVGGSLRYIQVNGAAGLESRTSAFGAGKGAALPFSMTTSRSQASQFLRPEDGAFDPSNPNDYYFVTTDRYDQVKDGVGSTVGRSRLWKASFSDLTNPNTGGNITMLLDGSEFGQMFDNITIDTRGHILIQEDVGGQAHNGKIFAYDIASGAFNSVAMHDRSRFGDVGLAATAPFNNDEESSGIIDAESILGPGWFLLNDQAHYTYSGVGGSQLTYEVEGGQLLAMFIPNAAFVPEPTSLALLGLVGVAALKRRRN